MKKNNTCQQNPRQRTRVRPGSLTIGMDLGDKTSRYCVLDEQGEIVQEGSVGTTKKALGQKFGALRRSRMAVEVGTHSPWVSRLLAKLGHEVIVANARQVKLISQSSRKDDRLDAQTLARLARVDPQLLRPIQHRSEEAQAHLMVIRVRAALVETRTSLVNTARGLAKSVGERLPKCDADQLGVERMEGLPAQLQQALRPLLEQIESVTEKIKESDGRIEQIAGTAYPETALLKQVRGNLDRSDVCVDHRRSRPIPEEPGCGLLCGLKTQAQRVGRESASTADHQGRRRVFEEDAGARSAVHSRLPGTGHGSEALGSGAGLARRQECEEAGHRGGGQKAGDFAASVVGNG